MDIYPQDLGSRWHLALARKRAAALPPHRGRGPLRGGGDEDGAAVSAPERGRVGRLGRWWSGGAGLDRSTAATGIAALGDRPRRAATLLALHSLGMAGAAVATLFVGPDAFPATAMLSLTALASGAGSALLPRWWFRRVHNRPLGAGEVDDLFAMTQDELERTYLTLVREVARQSVPAEAGEALRASLRALGEAIHRLPPGTTTAAAADTAALRREAAQVRNEARSDADPVTAASLERQAEALERRAEALARSNTLVRRGAVLRREMVAQIEALRAGLIGFDAGATDTSGLAFLAESARDVAAEAASVAAAREELDGRPGGGTAGEQQRRTRVPESTSAEAQETRPVPLRPGRG